MSLSIAVVTGSNLLLTSTEGVRLYVADILANLCDTCNGKNSEQMLKTEGHHHETYKAHLKVPALNHLIASYEKYRNLK